jgi:hypothetical protein
MSARRYGTFIEKCLHYFVFLHFKSLEARRLAEGERRWIVGGLRATLCTDMSNNTECNISSISISER